MTSEQKVLLGRQGQVLGDTYRLVRRIGEGGMGEIYEASHARIERRFAVKILRMRRTESSDMVARFKREAMLGSRLGHDHIVKVVDFAHTDDAYPYIVMELLEGENLGQRLTRKGRLPLEQALSITRQVGLALSSAHAEKVVHRDLKPDNIFLCKRQGGGILVKVMDFGISKVTSSDSIVTEQYAVLGTPAYMSPEQADGRVEDIDLRTDVYSLAVVLYHMLSGKVPFRGDKVSAILYQVVHNLPPPLHKVRNDLPAELSSVVQRAIQKRRADRQQSMDELAADLERAMGDRWSSVLMQEVKATRDVEVAGAAGDGGSQTPPMVKSCEGTAFRSTVDSGELEPVENDTALMRGMVLEETFDSDELFDTTADPGEVAFDSTVDSGEHRTKEEQQEDTLKGHGPVPPPAENEAAPPAGPAPGPPTVLLDAPPTHSWVRLALPASLAVVALVISAVMLFSGEPERRGGAQESASSRTPAPKKPVPKKPVPKKPVATTKPVAAAKPVPDPVKTVTINPAANARPLTVTTRPPGAKVLVGGRLLGFTPLKYEPVGPGALRVELRKKGYHREVRRVPAGTDPVRLGATLRPQPASLRVVAMHGTESVKAEVSVNGKPRDQTPAVMTGMTPGNYKLRVTAAGFLPWTNQVTLRPGEQKRVVAVMKR